jgi:replicative DNA helicase
LSGAREAIQRGAKIIFLDNMTAMRLPRGDRRDLEFQDFLVQARALANESGVPFVVISHAKRREGLDVDQLPLLTDCAESSAFEKLCRLAYGLCRNKDSNTLTVGVLKNTNGRAWRKFDLELRPDSALVDGEKEKPGPQPWPWSEEVRDGDGRL